MEICKSQALDPPASTIQCETSSSQAACEIPATCLSLSECTCLEAALSSSAITASSGLDLAFHIPPA